MTIDCSFHASQPNQNHRLVNPRLLSWINELIQAHDHYWKNNSKYTYHKTWPSNGKKTNQQALFLWLIDNATVVCLGGGEAI